MVRLGSAFLMLFYILSWFHNPKRFLFRYMDVNRIFKEVGMKKRKFAFILPLILCVMLIFTGCGMGSKYIAREDGFVLHNEMPAAPSEPFGGKTDAEPASESGNKPPFDALQGRMIIKNAELTVQTLEYDSFMTSLTERIASFGGYISNSSQSGRALSNPDNLRSASLVVKIPAEKLDEFLKAVGTLGNITRQSENAEDITTAYVDTEAKLEALRAEHDALISMLEKAEAIADIIVIQDRLNEVRYEIEAHERIIRSYDDQVAFSTVSMYINEVKRETPAGDETFSQEVSRKFSESLADIGHGFTRFSVWFLGNAPKILIWLVLLIVIPLIIILSIVKCRKRRKKQRTKLKNAAPEKIAESNTDNINIPKPPQA